MSVHRPSLALHPPRSCGQPVRHVWRTSQTPDVPHKLCTLSPSLMRLAGLASGSTCTVCKRRCSFREWGAPAPRLACSTPAPCRPGNTGACVQGELLAQQEAESERTIFTDLHTSMSRIAPEAADSLWSALQMLSYRLTAQRAEQLRLTLRTHQLAVSLYPASAVESCCSGQAEPAGRSA